MISDPLDIRPPALAPSRAPAEAGTPIMTEPQLVAVPDALADFAVLTRPDLDREDVRRALVACQTVGWPWNRTLIQASLMLAHLETPRDLKTATTDPAKFRKHVR